MAMYLPTDVETSIRRKVESGRFPDAGEVVREALRLLDDQERRLAELRAKLQVGLDQLARGEGVDMTPEVWERIQQEADERFRRGDRPDPDVCP